MFFLYFYISIFNNQIKMLQHTSTDDNLETLTYAKAYTIISKKVTNYCKKHSLTELFNELKKDNRLKISMQTLSYIKNKNLPHQYPDTIRKLFIFFGGESIKYVKCTLFTIEREQVNNIRKDKI